MKKYSVVLIIFGLIFCLQLYPAKAATISYAPQYFTESSLVTIPTFDASLGTLNSITHTITNMSLATDFILDVDDNLGPLSIDSHNIYSHNITVGPGYTATIIQFSSVVSGVISGIDDGDGAGSYNGGADEIIWNVSYSNLSGTKTIEDPSYLATFITNPEGPYIISLSQYIYDSGLYAGGGGFSLSRNTELFIENKTFDGYLTVEYNYSPVPLPSTVLLLLPGLFSIFITRKKLTSIWSSVIKE